MIGTQTWRMISRFIPGAKELMKRAEKKSVEITVKLLLKESNSPLALSVLRKLYSVLKRKTTGQSRNQLKALAESQGLEAWRLIRANLCRIDGQRLQGGYDTLTTLAPVKLADFKDFPTLHVRWESELKKVAAIGAEYRLGKYQ